MVMGLINMKSIKACVVGSTPTGVTKLIKMLQHAHAAELAAYHAYQGHWESLSDPKEVEQVKRIQADELEHINMLKRFLKEFDAEPNETRDKIFISVGKRIGQLCKVTGWRMPMLVASLMEKVGVHGYNKMATYASYLTMYNLSNEFELMAKVEQEHDNYFKSLM